ncbi:response regulator [Solimonas sp. SE-A11]|uniref:response regulator n=1 Tax=Solimonas sp. SE-A11 TaxID=3054954 RepID=UPI00259CF87B|nr:response regulator [Solimonas sp. SE-A11]MDM4773043.1 response regulator [Solimonas sp. SE-A11]
MRSQTKTVFVIDDNPDILLLTCQMVRALGLRAVAFSNADECLADLGSGTADCILTDLNMPGMSGLDLAKTIALHGPRVPIVIATASPIGSVELTGASKVARAVLHKPYTLDDLSHALRLATDVNRA